MKEVAIQRSILDLLEQAGGYGFKMSNQFAAGIPDLFVIWPGFCPVLMEVKDLGLVTRTSSLKIPLTPLQRKRLLDVNKLGTFGLVATTFELEGEKYGYVSRPEEERINFSGFDFSSPGGFAIRTFCRRKGKFNLRPVFDWHGVPRGPDYSQG